jgi:hypothetical protein
LDCGSTFVNKHDRFALSRWGNGPGGALGGG